METRYETDVQQTCVKHMKTQVHSKQSVTAYFYISSINETMRCEHNSETVLRPEPQSAKMGASLTRQGLRNIFKVEILGLTERLNSLRQRERGERCSLERGRERGRGWLPGGKGDGGEKEGGAS